MSVEDTLDSVLAELTALAQERAALDERYKGLLVRLESTVLDGMRHRAQLNGEGVLVVAVTTMGPEKGGNANPQERLWDWFNTAVQSGIAGTKTGALVSKLRSL